MSCEKCGRELNAFSDEIVEFKLVGSLWDHYSTPAKWILCRDCYDLIIVKATDAIRKLLDEFSAVEQRAVELEINPDALNAKHVALKSERNEIAEKIQETRNRIDSNLHGHLTWLKEDVDQAREKARKEYEQKLESINTDYMARAYKTRQDHQKFIERETSELIAKRELLSASIAELEEQLKQVDRAQILKTEADSHRKEEDAT